MPDVPSYQDGTLEQTFRGKIKVMVLMVMIMFKGSSKFNDFNRKVFIGGMDILSGEVEVLRAIALRPHLT